MPTFKTFIHQKIAVVVLVAMLSPACLAADIVVSIKPFYSIIKSIVGDKHRVHLLLDNQSSPHHFRLRPSHHRLLQNSDALFYTDDNFETFLRQPALKVKNRYRFIDYPLPTLLASKADHHHGEEHHDDHDNHRDEHDKHGHDDHDSHSDKMAEDKFNDPHIWFNIDNMKVIAKQSAQHLAALYPEDADYFGQNTQQLLTRLDALKKQLQTILQPARQKNYIVLHDAYQYWTEYFQLNPFIPLLDVEGQSGSAKRLSQIKRTIADNDIQCVFTEPQLSDKLIRTVTDKPIKPLDPVGSGVPADADAYFTLMQNMATTIAQCQ